MKKAFTLIELLITTAIVAIMAVMAVPVFDNLGRSNSFKQKATEMRDTLEQVHVDALNPEKGITRYYTYRYNFSPASFNFAKIAGDPEVSSPNTTIIKTIYPASGATIEPITGDTTDPVPSSDQSFFYCDISTKNCCQKSTIVTPGYCTAPAASTYVLKMTNAALRERALFKVYSNPYRVELIYQKCTTSACTEWVNE